MRIVSLTVVDDQGVSHTWEGVEGWLRVRTQSAKKGPYQQGVDAHLLLPPADKAPTA
jgi:hypothetical protein